MIYLTLFNETDHDYVHVYDRYHDLQSSFKAIQAWLLVFLLKILMLFKHMLSLLFRCVCLHDLHSLLFFIFYQIFHSLPVDLFCLLTLYQRERVGGAVVR